MDHDDVLRGDALALVGDSIAKNPGARIIYTDEDKINEHGVRSEPYMKGGWNRELFYAQNFLNHLTVIRRDVIDKAGPLRSAFDGSQDYDLLLRCIESAGEELIPSHPVCLLSLALRKQSRKLLHHTPRARMSMPHACAERAFFPHEFTSRRAAYHTRPHLYAREVAAQRVSRSFR